MVELAMNYETLVRDRAQAQSQADTLREQAIGDVPIDPAAVPLMSGIGDHADALRQVVETIAGLLGADGGALAVVDDDGAVQWVTATSQPAYLLTQIEQDFEEGPGVDARATGQPVAIPDLRLGQRWLRLGPVAASHSVRAALAAPVPADGQTLGALTVIMATPRLWSQAEAQAISGYASILGRLLVTAADAAQQRRLAGQLQTALDRRIVIEQAKGVLMARKGLPSSQAFQVLRHMARSSGASSSTWPPRSSPPRTPKHSLERHGQRRPANIEDGGSPGPCGTWLARSDVILEELHGTYLLKGIDGDWQLLAVTRP